MELTDIKERLEYQLEETEGFFEIDLDFELERTVVVVAGHISKDFEPSTQQFYGKMTHQKLEVSKCWIQFPDFEAVITDENILEIEKHFEL